MGDVVISVDAELAWGYHDRPTLPDRVADARQGWSTALELFDAHGIPATWAIVGHLFLDRCDGRHADHPLGPSWFDRDPGRRHEPDDVWYAPDLVDAVLDAETDHELGSHTFSHVLMDEPSVTRAVADAELSICRRLLEARGHSFDSFVFPRNRVGQRAALAEAGATCYRSVAPAARHDDAPLRPLAKLADWAVGSWTPPIVQPTVDEFGLVDLPASLYLFCFEGAARRAVKPLWDDPIVTVAERGIDAVHGRDGVLHLWFHPHNLLQPDGRERLDAVLGSLAERRDGTDLRVVTMGELAAETLAEHREVAS